MKYLVLALSLFLVACGGSGGGSGAPASDVGNDSETPSAPEANPPVTDNDYTLVEGMYSAISFEGDVQDDVYIYDGTAFLLDRGTSYRFIVNTTLTNGSYEALVLDFDKGSELSWVSGASPSYVNGLINEDATGTTKLTALSVDTFELVVGDYKYTMQAQYLTTDPTTDDAYFIQSFLTPLPWATSYIEYNFGYLTISLQNGCVYTTPETIKVRGIVYGQNFVSNCAVDFEYFNGVMIDDDYSIYDTVWFYVI